MAATWLSVAQGLAIAGFCAIVAHAAISALWPLGAHTSGIVVAPIGAFASMAAFVVSLNRRTMLVPALLVATGLVGTVDGMMDPSGLAPIVPGPILGLIFGIAILVLGAAKIAMVSRSRYEATARREVPKGGRR